jgi:hypothetical protein
MTSTEVRSGCRWNSTEVMPDDASNEDVVIELNTDYSTRGLTANEVVAVVQAWQSGALSRDSMLDIFRRGEVLPEGRTNEEEVRLIAIAKTGTCGNATDLAGQRQDAVVSAA